MFLQVGVPPSDQLCLHFLVGGSPIDCGDTPVPETNFGARDSLTCTNFALQQTYPLVAKAVQQKFYVDDNLVSVDCPETALKLSQVLIKMLKLGGLKLTKFISNVNDLSETPEPVLVPHVKKNPTPNTSHV